MRRYCSAGPANKDGYMKFYKYHGAGNDFLIADNRNGALSLSAADVAALCHRHYGIGADGLMLLEQAPDPYSFRMIYYNSDGSGGMMCGNGGRCIAAFAHRLGIPVSCFIAADGPHSAQILGSERGVVIVRLKMRDVADASVYDRPDVKGCFIDTGTRHFVCPVTDIDNVDVDAEGRRLRHHPEFSPEGVNVNFIEHVGGELRVRTFEKGVEAETYACGTGIVAAAIAWRRTHTTYEYGQPIFQEVRALHDTLAVEFTPTPDGATDVWLTGPATFVAEIGLTHLPLIGLGQSSRG